MSAVDRKPQTLESNRPKSIAALALYFFFPSLTADKLSENDHVGVGRMSNLTAGDLLLLEVQASRDIEGLLSAPMTGSH